MSRRKRTQKVVKMKKRYGKLMGAFLLLFSAYLVFLGIKAATKEHIAIYEVTEKKIAEDNLVRGIILRNEKLVRSDQSGYINYYVGDGTKIGAKTKIYSIDQTGQVYRKLEQISMDAVKMDQQSTNDIRNAIAVYRDAYTLSDYKETYNFKYNLENTISELANEQLMDQVMNILQDTNDTTSFKFGHANESGIISYTSDGMENLTMNEIDGKIFDNMTDNMQQLRKKDSVDKDAPIFRLVTNESWSVIFPLTEDQFKVVQSQGNILITLKKIQAKLSPPVTTFTMDDKYYARVDLKRYMIQYINNRFIDLEIEMNDQGGLKIPGSSIVHKRFYKIPEKYRAVSQSGEAGVLVVSYKKDGTPVFTHRDTELLSLNNEEAKASAALSASQAAISKPETYYYVPADEFQQGTVIASDNGLGDTMTLTATEELEGVYCCNKGYCEFYPIELVYKNNEYCIVKGDTPNGLSAYDHIILNPKLMNENDIIS